MRIKTWLKTWGPLFAAGIALVLSGYAIYVDNVHYQEVTKPYAQHNEIYNMLVRLDGRIEEVEGWIVTSQDLGQDTTESQINLRKAVELRDEAELAWVKGHYNEADVLINEAFDNLQKITITIVPVGIAWWVWVIVGVAVVIGGLLAYFLWWGRRAA